MRRPFGTILLVGVFHLHVAATPTFAAAQTCAGRQQVCFAYCEKNYNNAPNCRNACADYLNICISTGCWESKVTAKRCGFSRQ